MAYFKREEDLNKLSLLHKECLKLLQENALYLLIIEGDYDDYTSLNNGESINGQFEELNSFVGKFQLGAYVMEEEVSTQEGDIVYGSSYKRVYFTMENCPYFFNEVPLFFFPKAENSSDKEILDSIRDNLLEADLFYHYESETKAKRMGVYAVPIYSRYKERYLFYYVNIKYWNCDEKDFVEGGTNIFRIFCLCNKKRKEVLYAYTLSCSRFWKEDCCGGSDCVQVDYYDKLICLKEGDFKREVVKV